MCRGSPIDKRICRCSGFGVISARIRENFWNGYGCSKARAGARLLISYAISRCTGVLVRVGLRGSLRAEPWAREALLSNWLTLSGPSTWVRLEHWASNKQTFELFVAPIVYRPRGPVEPVSAAVHPEIERFGCMIRCRPGCGQVRNSGFCGHGVRQGIREFLLAI